MCIFVSLLDNHRHESLDEILRLLAIYFSKPRLFICGDSFVDWDIPTYHWTDYLKEHYDVIILGERGSDNISIIFQLGDLPQYKDGDRIIMGQTHQEYKNFIGENINQKEKVDGGIIPI